MGATADELWIGMLLDVLEARRGPFWDIPSRASGSVGAEVAADRLEALLRELARSRALSWRRCLYVGTMAFAVVILAVAVMPALFRGDLNSAALSLSLLVVAPGLGWGLHSRLWLSWPAYALPSGGEAEGADTRLGWLFGAAPSSGSIVVAAADLSHALHSMERQSAGDVVSGLVDSGHPLTSHFVRGAWTVAPSRLRKLAHRW